MRIKSFDVLDVRFPTSLVNAGTDAVHKDPDYSAAYVIRRTDGAHEGYGIRSDRARQRTGVQAIRRWNPPARENVLAAISDAPPPSGTLAYDSQLRWLGPEKGVVPLAPAALVNALWDLQASAAA